MEFVWWLGLILLLALAFDFFNGLTDSGALVATMLSTGAMSPRLALVSVAFAELIGPFLFGAAVATTIGTGIVNPRMVTAEVVLVALFSALAWNVLAWRLGLPTSSTHALVGSITGAAIAADGLQVLAIGGLLKIAIALLAGPTLGGFLGYVSLKLTVFILRGATPRVNRLFKRGQIVTSLALAVGHGAMDAQKTMGVITLAFVAAGVFPTFNVPLWVTALSAAFLSLGVSLGGWYTIRTLGARIYRVRPVHGFTSQASSAAIVLVAALLGGPLSVAQVVSSAIVGAGAGERVSKVRWGVAGTMIVAWMLTMPVTAVVAAATYKLVAPLLQL
ncbi:MAG: inorganic phosphate transporter [Chloroflexi bacterium]|nr:inorganic phosphate transporter [Chloroflexota bacterium]